MCDSDATALQYQYVSEKLCLCMSIQAASSVCMTVHVCVCSVHNIHLSPMRKTTFEPIFTKKSSAALKVYLPGKGDGRAVLVRVNHTAGFLGRAPWPAPRCHAQLQYGHMADT